MKPYDIAMLHSARKSGGFTLMEAMIVVAIISVLAAIAYPSYQQYVIRSNRSAAQQLMMQIASREEQYILDSRVYTATIGTGGLGFGADNWDCTTDATKCTNSSYTITVSLVAGPPPGYTITAATVAGSLQASDGNLTLDNTGAKTPPEKWTGR